MKIFLLSCFLGILTTIGLAQEATQNIDTKMKESRVLGLRTSIYKVENINQAKIWYSKAFQTEPYFDEPYYVGFKIGGYELGLVPDENHMTTEKVESVMTYWGVENIQELYDYLLELGATAYEEPTNRGGDLVTAAVKDPFGNILGLIYNPYFKLPE